MNKEDIPPITSEIYIILSSYNEEDTLEEVVDGLVERGFKVLIIDDGSKDNTPAIAKNLVRKYNPKYKNLYGISDEEASQINFMGKDSNVTLLPYLTFKAIYLQVLGI